MKKINIKRGKRGIAPLIATVLLIGITIALAILIFVWVWGMVSEQIEKFGTPAEIICQDNINFNADVAPIGDDDFNLYVNNLGNVPIHAVNLKIFDANTGKSEVMRVTVDVGAGGSYMKELDQEIEDKLNFANEVIIIPVILGNVEGEPTKKPYPCPEEYGKHIPLTF